MKFNHYAALLCVLLGSAGCVSSAIVEESGLGLESSAVEDASILSNGASSTSAGSAAFSGFRSHSSDSSSACNEEPTVLRCSPAAEEARSILEGECRWFACEGGTCLAIQMCWRVREDGGATCTFWDYPGEVCCPDTAGQVVNSKE